MYTMRLAVCKFTRVCCWRVICRPFDMATSVCINSSQNEPSSWSSFQSAEHLSAEKPSCVSQRCRKLIRFKKVMVEVLRFVSAFFFFFSYHLKKGQHQNSTWTLISHPEEGFKMKKKSIIPLYLHNPALLKAGEPPSDLEISMLSPSVSLLSFRKTGKCADTWTHRTSTAEMLIRKRGVLRLRPSAYA